MSGPHGTGPDPAWSPPGTSGDPAQSQNPGEAYDTAGAQPQPSPYAPPSPYGQYPAAGAYPPPDQYPAPPAGQYPPPAQYPQYGTPQYGTPQYGTPQYGTPQYGTPQYGTPQYGTPQYGAPGTGQYVPPGGGPDRPKGSPKVVYGLIGGLAVAILAAVAVLGFWKPGFFVTTELSASGAQQGVQRVLTAGGSDGFGAQNVSNVVCNGGSDIAVSDGGTFSCTVSIDGSERTVTATFRGSDGTYEVGRPR